MPGVSETIALITGASSGVGLALARRLRKAGYRLVLTARESSLARFGPAGFTEGDNVFLRPLDITQADQRQAVVDEAERRWGGIDVLVNNAGLSYRAVVEHVTEADQLAQMNVNFRAPTDLIRLVLPGMRARRHGRILNVSSVGGMMAMPTMGIYSASKFALEGMSEALYYEVKPWGIHVSLIQPGFINSSGFENVRYTTQSRTEHALANTSYHAHYANMNGFIAKVARRVPATPDSVARTIERTIRAKTPPLRVPATFDAVVFSVLRRLLPRRFYHWVLYRSLPSVKTWGVIGSLPPPPLPRAPKGQADSD